MVGWKVALWAVVVAAALWFFYAVRSILLPFIVAFIISSLLEPTVRKLRTRGYKRVTAVLIIFVAFFGLLTAIGFWAGPVIANQISKVRATLEYYSTQLSAEDPNTNYFISWNPVVQATPPSQQNEIDKLLESVAPVLSPFGIPTTRKAIVEQYVKPHEKEISAFVQRFFRGFLDIIGTAASQLIFLIFMPIFVLLMLLDMERFKVRFASWIPPSIRAETLAILRDIGAVFISYLRGITIAVLCYAAFMSIILTILGAPYSVLLALLFAALYPIPYLGPAINMGVLVIVTGLSGTNANWFMSFPTSWTFGVVISLMYIACSLLFDNLVYPQLVGKAVGLHPIVSMFVIFSGGALFGVIGMLLAFPLAGTAKIILERVLRITSTSEQEGLGLPAIPLRHRTASEI